MMLIRHNPQEAYRRIDFDARVAGADPQELVALCYEQLTTALGSALFAAEQADNQRKSEALTRALSALTALQLGVSQNRAIAPALLQLYEAARQAVLDSVLQFDPRTIAMIRHDFADILQAMRRDHG